MELQEALARLRAPFPADKVQFRVGGKSRGKYSVLAYLDARQVAERIEEVDPRFRLEHGKPTTHSTSAVRMRKSWVDKQSVETPVPQIRVTVPATLAIMLPGDKYGTDRTDVGEAVGDEDDVKIAKSAYSDAVKRAAVWFGIGRNLYDLPDFTVEESDVNYGRISASALTKLRAQYAKHIAAQPATPIPVTKPLSDTDTQAMIELATAAGAKEDAVRQFLTKQSVDNLEGLLVRAVRKYVLSNEIDPVNEVALYQLAANGDSASISASLAGSAGNLRVFDAVITND